MKKIILLSLIATGISGCAGYTPRLNVDDKPAETDAFFYGRFHFHIDTPQSVLDLAFDRYPSMGLGIQCSDGSHYVVRFYKKNPVHVVKVKPAVCNLVEMVYSDSDGRAVGRKPYTQGMMQNMQIKPKVAYYLGDFSGVLKEIRPDYSNVRSIWEIPRVNTVRTVWEISSVKFEFEGTTKDMRELYPNLSNVATEAILQ